MMVADPKDAAMTHGAHTTSGLIAGVMITAFTAVILAMLLHILGLLHEPTATLFVVVGSNAMGIVTFAGIAEERG